MRELTIEEATVVGGGDALGNALITAGNAGMFLGSAVIGVAVTMAIIGGPASYPAAGGVAFVGGVAVGIGYGIKSTGEARNGGGGRSCGSVSRCIDEAT